jgi:hypothetical protein
VVERGGTRPTRRVDPPRQASAQLLTKARILLKADVSDLNKRGVPTATGRSLWEPVQVRRVMERAERGGSKLA